MSKIIISIVISCCIAFAFSSCCVQSTPKDEHRIDYVRDSIGEYVLTRYYGSDSVYYYNNKSGILEGIDYIDSTSIVTSIRYKQGVVYSIEYNSSFTKDFLREEIFHEGTNKIWLQSYDYFVVNETSGTPVVFQKYFKQYYRNGELEEEGYQGDAWGNATYVGQWKHYDQTGLLTHTIEYIFPKPIDQDSLQKNSVQYPFKVVKLYNPKGELKSRQILVHNDFFESDEDTPLGIWEYYDTNGKIIKSEFYSKFDEKRGVAKK